jgi:hypothetical protein
MAGWHSAAEPQKKTKRQARAGGGYAVLSPQGAS